MSGDRALGRTHPRRELDTVLLLKCCDVCLCQPNRDLDRNRDAVVGEHELLQRLVTQLVGNRCTVPTLSGRVAAAIVRGHGARSDYP